MSSLNPTSSLPTLRWVALATLIIMLVGLSFWLLLGLRNMLVSVFLGLLLATALRPLMDRLRFGKLSQPVAASAAMLLVVSLILGGLVLVTPLVIAQMQTLPTELNEIYHGLREQLVGSQRMLLRQIGYRLDPELSFGSGNIDLMTALPAWLPIVGTTVFIVVCTLLFSYYWLLYRERSLRGMLLLLPIERRAGAETLWLLIEERMGAFLRGQALLGLMSATLSLAGYLVIGIPFAVLLAVLAGVLEFVPFVGPAIAIGIAAMVGLSNDPQQALWVVLLGLAIQQLQNMVVAPRIMSHTTGVSPVVTLLAAIGFSALLGPAGGLLAIPLAAALQVLFNAWIDRRADLRGEQPTGRTKIDRVRYELRQLTADIASHLRIKEGYGGTRADVVEESLEQLLQDLDVSLATRSATQSAPAPQTLP